MASNAQVISAYIRGEAKHSGSLYSDGVTIYSYGSHFPIATRRSDGSYLINRDKYSMTTSHHQSAVFGAIAYTGATMEDCDTGTIRAYLEHWPEGTTYKGKPYNVAVPASRA